MFHCFYFYSTILRAFLQGLLESLTKGGFRFSWGREIKSEWEKGKRWRAEECDREKPGSEYAHECCRILGVNHSSTYEVATQLDGSSVLGLL